MESLFQDLPDLPTILGKLVVQIPPGRVTTYGALAEALGAPEAARWIGHWMLHHEHTDGCVCHRVVRADGQIGLYVAGEPGRKAALLRAEGIPLDRNRIGSPFPEGVFREFRTARPLERLRQLQCRLRGQVRLRGRRTMPRLVAGVDVSYVAGEGAAAYALWSVEAGELVWSTTVHATVDFPYIPGFLAFRELPILLDLVRKVRAAGRMADVVIVDGSGVLHPRRAGIACHFGALISTATIGVSKKLLCGKVDLHELKPDQPRPVLVEGRRLGVALRATPGSRRPLFISPGHRIGVDMAERIVRRLLLGRRLPEPQYWADRLSRSAARSLGR